MAARLGIILTTTNTPPATRRGLSFPINVPDIVYQKMKSSFHLAAQKNLLLLRPPPLLPLLLHMT
jgi:hypothetical protein